MVAEDAAPRSHALPAPSTRSERVSSSAVHKSQGQVAIAAQKLLGWPYTAMFAMGDMPGDIYPQDTSTGDICSLLQLETSVECCGNLSPL